MSIMPNKRSLGITGLIVALMSGCGTSSGKLSFTPDIVELTWGSDAKGQQQAKVILENRGGKTLTISEVSSSCACTTAKLGKFTLAPGERTELSLDVHVPEFGDQDVVVSLQTDSRDSPLSTLPLKLKGRTLEVPRLWRIAPITMASFREPGVAVTAKVEVVTLEAAGSKPWIVGLQPDSNTSTTVSCQMASHSDDTRVNQEVVVRTYSFEVTIEPDRLERITLNLTLLTNGRDQEQQLGGLRWSSILPRLFEFCRRNSSFIGNTAAFLNPPW